MTDFLSRLVKHDVWAVVSENIGLKDSQSLVFSLSLVSKFFSTWSHISLKSILFDDSSYQISEETLKRILDKCPNLKRIELMMCLNLTPESFKRVLTTPSMNSLRIVNCSQLSSASFLQLFENCTNLQEIEFFGFKVGYQPKSIFHYLSLCPKLKILNIKRNEELTEDIGKLKNLEELQYEMTSFHTNNHFDFSFPELPNLRSLLLEIRFTRSPTLSFVNLTNLQSLELRPSHDGFILKGPISTSLRTLKTNHQFLKNFNLVDLSKHLTNLQLDISYCDTFSHGGVHSPDSWKLLAKEVAKAFNGVSRDCTMNILVHTHALLENVGVKGYAAIQKNVCDEFKQVVPSCIIQFSKVQSLNYYY